MFRITSDPSSGSFIQCLAKITVTITVILGKNCLKLPDDGSFVIRNMWDHFTLLYFTLLYLQRQ